MKRNILMFAASLAVCTGVAQGQDGDTPKKKNTDNTSVDQARNTAASSTTYNSGDVEIIQPNNVPTPLKSVLEKDEKYSDWENAIIYRNKRTGEYLVSPRAHRFDKDANPIDYPGDKRGRKTQRVMRTTSEAKHQISLERQRSADGNGQSGNDVSDVTSTGKQYSSSAAIAAGQDTSSQAMSSTDQGRQASTAGRLQQNKTSETSSQRNNQGRDSRKQSADTGNAYRTEGAATGNLNTNDTEMSMEGLTPIQAFEIPVSLKETLADDQYKGWETGKLYRHEPTGEYVLAVDEKTPGEGKQTYRFDRDGKMMNGASHQGN